MRIWVIKRKTLLILAVIAAIIILLTAFLVVRCQSANAASTVSAAAIEEYELNVLAGKKRELPVYAVARSDQAVALTSTRLEDGRKPTSSLERFKSTHVRRRSFCVAYGWRRTRSRSRPSPQQGTRSATIRFPTRT